MNNFSTITTNLYVHKSDIPILRAGGETKAHISAPNENEYTLINKHAFHPSLQLDNNTFLVTFIMD